MAGIRRTWDKALYEQRAKDRLERGDDFTDSSKDAKVNRAKLALREEFRAADANASGPIGSERAFLKARERKLGLEDRAGKVEIINPADAEGQKAGFWCEVCSVLLKDSASYLAHVNGKKHQHALGYSMKVERASIDDVRERLQRQKSRSNGGGKAIVSIPVESGGSPQKSNEQNSDDETQNNRKRKETSSDPEEEEKEHKRARKVEEEEDDASVEAGEDDEMMKMMGFSGFGSKKK